MNRLWVRLSLAFGIVVLIGVGFMIGVSLLLSRANAIPVPGFDTAGSLDALIGQLVNLYQHNRTWENADLLLQGAAAIIPPDVGAILTLRDTQGQVLYSSQADSDTTSERSKPVFVDGQLKATLFISLPNGGLPSEMQHFFLDRLIDFLLMVAGVGGVGGIIFSVVISRGLAAPLGQLATAARAIGARNLRQRVAVKGSREITDLARAFNDMAAALEQSESLRRNLVADVAHELRTPLTVLQGSLLAILDEVYPLNNVEIAKLYNQTHLLNRLVNDLHELSLAEAQQLPLHKQMTNVGELLEGIRSAFEPIVEASSLRLEVRYPPDLPLCQFDSMRITQVLDNLLGNALRHTPAGGTIALEARMATGRLELIVKDTGEGIAAEHLVHVFDRFYRTNRERARNTDSSGLGLAIVQAIVNAHGGQVHATSEGIPGHGTMFSVDIPCQACL